MSVVFPVPEKVKNRIKIGFKYDIVLTFTITDIFLV